MASTGWGYDRSLDARVETLASSRKSLHDRSLVGCVGSHRLFNPAPLLRQCAFNSCAKGVPLGLRPAKGDEDIQGGHLARTPDTLKPMLIEATVY